MMAVNDFLERTSGGLDRLVCGATVLSTASFTLLIFISVLSRYVFNFSILFSQEVSKLLFIWACFLAATVAYRRKAHIRFEFIDRLLHRRNRLISDVLVHSTSLVFFLCILVESVSYFRQIWETYFPLIGISQGWLYVSVTVAALVLIVHNLWFLAESITALWSGDADEAPRAGGDGC